MADSFNCPNCGAPLDYKGSDPIIRCPFCNSSVIVPDNLRGQPSFSSQPHNFTMTGSGDLGALISQARRFKEVKELAMAGREDEAIQLYMGITGANADISRSSVESLARGLPIKFSSSTGAVIQTVLSGPGGVNPPIPFTQIPANNYDPITIDQKSGRGLLRTIGCGIGCFTAGMVIFILIVTLVPAAAGLMGMAVGLNPNLVLTMLPLISTVDTTPVPTTIKELTNTPEARKTPTAAPTATAGFANQVFSFGKAGAAPGSFGDVRAIAIDPVTSTIYVADYTDGRVQAFNLQGKFITQWIVPGSNLIIQGMAADHKGNLYVVASGNILVYNVQWELTTTLKPASLNDHYEDVAVLSDGSLMVVSRGENVVHLSTAGKVLNRFDQAISHITGKAELGSKIAVDGSGNIYLLGIFSNAVFIYNPQGKFLRRFGSDGDQPGEFRAPMALAVDAKGHIYVSDIKGVQIFSNDGSYNNVLKVNGVAFGLTFDDQGSLYLTTNQKTVEKYKIPQ